MSRDPAERLQDVLDAITAIRSHLSRGDLSDGLVYDAVKARLMEIGEAVKAIPPDVLAAEPSQPWSAIARMRDRLAHHYFDTEHGHVAGTVADDLGPLESAVRRLQAGTALPPAQP